MKHSDKALKSIVCIRLLYRVRHRKAIQARHHSKHDLKSVLGKFVGRNTYDLIQKELPHEAESVSKIAL